MALYGSAYGKGKQSPYGPYGPPSSVPYAEKGKDNSYAGKGADYGKGASYSSGGKGRDTPYGRKGPGKPVEFPTDPDEQWEMMQWMEAMMDSMKKQKGAKGGSGAKGASGVKGKVVIKGKGKDGKDSAAKNKKQPSRHVPWKLQLSNAYAARHRKCPTKETIIYETIEEGGSFTCSVSCEDFALPHEAPGTFDSKKDAEESAAKVALEQEYPEYAAKVVSTSPSSQAGAYTKAKNLTWKRQLEQAYAQEHNEPPSKDDIAYTVEQRDDGWIASVTCYRFINEYVMDDVQPSKTLAEERAAKVALEGEFPDFSCADVPPAATGVVIRPPPTKKSKQGKVEAQAGISNGTMDAKSRLNEGLMIILGRSVIKGDVEYEVCDEMGSATASVTLHCLDVPQTFSGQAFGIQESGCTSNAQSKKLAQCSAAEAALATLEELIEEKRPEHEARKRAKAEEQRAKKEEREAKKSADGSETGGLT